MMSAPAKPRPAACFVSAIASPIDAAPVPTISRSRGIDAPEPNECRLAHALIFPGCLAERGGVRLNVEQIVGDLKSLAEHMAVLAERFACRFAGAPHDGAHFDRCGKQRAGLHRLET